MSKAGSDGVTSNHEHVDATGHGSDSRSQLNLALEKSISGC